MTSTPPSEIRKWVRETEFRLEDRGSVPEIVAQLNSVVLEGGKHLRPALCYWLAGIVGFPLSRMELYARAAEWVHGASLAHDDVIDQATVRRGSPTLNTLLSNKHAVLAGDFLLARVVAEISAEAPREVIIDLARTIETLVEGEWLQLESYGVLDRDAARLERATLLKTGSLIRWCCRTPAVLAELPPRLVELAAELGDRIGLAFQMVDDVIDFEASSGKEFGKDLAEGLVNWVTLEMMTLSPHLRPQLRPLLGYRSRGEPPPSRWPWSPEELTRAKDRVRARARLELEQANRLVDEIQRQSRAADPDFQNRLGQALKITLKEMGERNQ